MTSEVIARTSLILLLMLGSTPAANTSAQTVQGVVRDEHRGTSIAGARLQLLATGGVVVDATRTDADGRFRLAAPTTGRYTLYFQLDGWASVPSDRLHLEQGVTTDFTFAVPLVSNAAIRQMSDMIEMDERLQKALPEMCGEPLRPWEAGLLVGVVRERATDQPVAGARIGVSATDGTVARSTISSARGIYILCNVPLGAAVRITVQAPDGTSETTDVEIRAGMVSWYDLPVGPRR